MPRGGSATNDVDDLQWQLSICGSFLLVALLYLGDSMPYNPVYFVSSMFSNKAAAAGHPVSSVSACIHSTRVRDLMCNDEFFLLKSSLY